MANLLIVNPSVNMRLAALEMKMYGNSVDFAYTSDYPVSNAERVFYFLSGVNICFTTEVQGEMEREDRVFLFKRNLISRFKMMGFKNNMESSYPELSAGTFTDLLALKRSVLRYEEQGVLDGKMVYGSYKDMLSYNKDSFVISSAIIGIGNENIATWETDFDLSSTFDKDYFVFFANNKRIEAYVCEDKLITIGKGAGESHIEAVAALMPFITKFTFNKIDEKQVMRNFNPWPQSFSGINGFLINDYSYGRLSVSMPSAWYDRIASYINTHCEKLKV